MARLLFDLVACQSNQGTMNHGGKEYGEAVLGEMIKQKVPLTGIYNSQLGIEAEFVDYCKQYGGLIDVQETTLQETLDTNNFSVFYSALPYSYNNIHWGNTRFLGNLHGLRPLEAFTDKYEYKYTTDFKSYIKAYLKGFGIVERYAKREFLNKIKDIINNPSFVCITGSEHSKFALLNFFPEVKPENIAVFYDPLNLESIDENIDKNTEKYYLLVSGNRWLKNTYRGIIALDQLISKGKINSKVVVTGTNPQMRYMKEIKNKDCFIFKNYVSSSELAALYHNAYCLIFLSLSEGFGYPPLEAIHRGTPVICSPLTALYEVYQNGVLYCDPLSIEDIKIKILEMEDPLIYNRYKEKGMRQAKTMVHMQQEELPKLVDFILSYC